MSFHVSDVAVTANASDVNPFNDSRNFYFNTHSLRSTVWALK